MRAEPCKHFTSVSPGMSGHRCQTDRAPMLVGTPGPVILSVFRALGPALWIRRVLVRFQEGQSKGPLAALFHAPPGSLPLANAARSIPGGATGATSHRLTIR